MALFKVNLESELDQVSRATDRIVSEQIKPLLDGTIDRTEVVIDNQRKLASQDAKDIIDHAVSRLETAFNEKLDQARSDIFVASQKIGRLLLWVALAIGLSASASIAVTVSVLLSAGK